MYRATTSGRRASVPALTMMVRVVWVSKPGASLPRATMRVRPACAASTPNGAAAQPTSTWPDMTWVKVAAGLPVATPFTSMPKVLARPRTTRSVDEPVVE